MTSNSRNSTPTKRYGEIIGSIFGNSSGGNGDDAKIKERSLSVGRQRKYSMAASTDLGSTINLLDKSVTEEAKRRFRERRHQSQSPIRRIGSNQQRLQQPITTIDMSNGRPITYEHRQPPPPSSSSSSPPSVTSGTTSLKPSYRQATSSSSSQPTRSATPPPAPRRNPLMIRRRHSAKFSTTKTNDYDLDISLSSPLPSTSTPSSKTGLPSTMSASAVRARSISPGWNRRRTNVPSITSSISTRCVDDNRGEESKTQHQHVSFADTIASAAKEKEVKKKISMLEKTVSEQQEQLRFYESRLKDGTAELNQLNREIIDRRKKQARLELELEVHDSKFSVYDDYRRLLDARRFEEQTFNEVDDDHDDDDDVNEQLLNGMEGRNDDNVKSAGRMNTNTTRRAMNRDERDLSRILSKLERFEATMKKFEQESDQRYSELCDEYMNALKKIQRLEKEQVESESPSDTITKEEMRSGMKLSKQNSDDDASDGNHSMISATISDPIHDLLLCTKQKKTYAGSVMTGITNLTESSSEYLLQKRIEMLEAENARQRLRILSLHEEIDRLNTLQSDTTVLQREQELTALRREKATLTHRVTALETELGYTMGNIRDKTRSRRYRTLEKNLNEYTVEIMSLEDKLRAKDSIILRLKERDLSRRLVMSANDTSLPSLCSSPKHDGTHLGETSKTPSHQLAMKDHQQVTKDGVNNDVFATEADISKIRMHKNIEVLKLRSSQIVHTNHNATKTDGLTMTSSLNSMAAFPSPSGSERVAMLRKRLDELSKINEKHMAKES